MAGSAPLRPDQPTEVATLIAHLGAGGLAVLPTDTVPGLAAEITQPGAADRLAEAKSSTPGRPFSLHLRSEQELRAPVPAPPPGMAAWLAHHLPGPWTVVLPRSWVALPREWDWPWETVGIRLPGGDAWRQWGHQLAAPLLMTSINPAGEPPLVGEALQSWCAARRSGRWLSSTLSALKPRRRNGPAQRPARMFAWNGSAPRPRRCAAGRPDPPGWDQRRD